MFVRSQELHEEEAAVLEALRHRLEREGIEVIDVLFGSASTAAESADLRSTASRSCWVLEDDVRGRGLRIDRDRSVRVVSSDELVAELMSSEKVIGLS